MKQPILLLAMATTSVFCQTPSNSKPPVKPVTSEPENTYIPTDLEDCFVQLQKLLSPEDIQKIKTGTESNMIEYHFSLGMGLRNDWGLWKGSRLAKWFNSKGIFHPDDMSGIILDSFWRFLNARPINLDNQIHHYQEFWEKQKHQLPPQPK